MTRTIPTIASIRGPDPTYLAPGLADGWLTSGIPGRRRRLFRAQQPQLLALPVALLDRRALVVELLALGQAEFHLGPAPWREVERQRHQGHAIAPHGPEQPAHLTPAEHQLAGPARLVIEPIAAVELGDVGVEQPEFPAHLAGMRLGDGGPALTQRLDLGAAQHQP